MVDNSEDTKDPIYIACGVIHALHRLPKRLNRNFISTKELLDCLNDSSCKISLDELLPVLIKLIRSSVVSINGYEIPKNILSGDFDPNNISWGFTYLNLIIY